MKIGVVYLKSQYQVNHSKYQVNKSVLTSMLLSKPVCCWVKLYTASWTSMLLVRLYYSSCHSGKHYYSVRFIFWRFFLVTASDCTRVLSVVAERRDSDSKFWVTSCEAPRIDEDMSWVEAIQVLSKGFSEISIVAERRDSDSQVWVTSSEDPRIQEYVLDRG